MKINLRKYVEIAKQSGEEAAEDRQFKDAFKQKGIAGLTPFKVFLFDAARQEFQDGDIEALGINIDIYPDRKRPYLWFQSFNIQYEITLVPPARPAFGRVWEVVAINRDGRRLVREQFPVTCLRAGLIGLMDAFSPQWAQFEGKIPGIKRHPDQTVVCPRQIVSHTASATRMIADDYWFVVDILTGRITGNTTQAQQWMDYIRGYAVPLPEAWRATIAEGFCRSSVVRGDAISEDADFIEPPLWSSWTILTYAYWWAGTDFVIGVTNADTEQAGFLIPSAALSQLPVIDP